MPKHDFPGSGWDDFFDFTWMCLGVLLFILLIGALIYQLVTYLQG